MEQVWELYSEELQFTVNRMLSLQEKIESTIQKHFPIPIYSLFLEGTLDCGMDVSKGGAKYNFSGVQAVGCADIADSMAALETVVFEDKRCTIQELIQALKADFKGYEHIQGYLLRAPKFGNNNKKVDKWMNRFI